jgi:hypothetical protein
MSNFIKLSSIVINASKIKTIHMQNNIYYITLTTKQFDGFMLFTNGYLNSINDKIEICGKKNQIDYNILSEWINKIK